MPSRSARIWWLRHTASSGLPASTRRATTSRMRRHPRVHRVAGIPGAGAGDDELGLVELLVGHLVPGHDAGVEPEVAQLVRQHRGEPILGVDHDGAVPGERAVARGILRVQPERGEPRVAGREQFGDLRVVPEGAWRGGRVGVRGRGARGRRPRHGGWPRSRRARPRPCRASRSPRRTGPSAARASRRPAPAAPVDEVGGADEDRGVEVVGRRRGRGRVGPAPSRAGVKRAATPE